jgi:hypothetical protein
MPVQRAEQLSMRDFDLGRRGGAYDPPHLIGGNPLAMSLRMALIDHDQSKPYAVALAFAGTDRHPNVLKVRTDNGDVDMARDLVRATGPDVATGQADHVSGPLVRGARRACAVVGGLPRRGDGDAFREGARRPRRRAGARAGGGALDPR